MSGSSSAAAGRAATSGGPGGPTSPTALLSTSRDPRVATENFSTEAVYAVLSRTGRSIEPFSAARHEREVVLLPGTVLTLVTRVRVKDLGVTIVEEFDPSAGQESRVDLAAVQEQIGRAILEAELADPVPRPHRGEVRRRHRVTHRRRTRGPTASQGVLLGAACGDALGVPYEFGSASLAPGEVPRMIGGGLGPYAPGEWSDDTQMAVVIARVAADHGLRHVTALDAVVQGWVDWLGGGATDVGAQTRQVLGAVAGEGSTRPCGVVLCCRGVRCTAAPDGRPATGR